MTISQKLPFIISLCLSLSLRPLLPHAQEFSHPRFDGLYQEKEYLEGVAVPLYGYLKFFEDGTLIIASYAWEEPLMAEDHLLKKWVAESKESVSLYNYSIVGSEIRFSYNGEPSIVDHVCQIKGNELKLKSYRHTDGKRWTSLYRFINTDSLKAAKKIEDEKRGQELSEYYKKNKSIGLNPFMGFLSWCMMVMVPIVILRWIGGGLLKRQVVRKAISVFAGLIGGLITFSIASKDLSGLDSSMWMGTALTFSTMLGSIAYFIASLMLYIVHPINGKKNDESA